MASRDRRSAVTLTVIASLLWGTSFPGTKWGLAYAGNDVFFLWLRFLIASAITLVAVAVIGNFRFSIFRKPIIWVIGGLNCAGFVMQYVGLTITNASKTALLVDINVVAVAIVSYFVFRERLGRWQVGGIVLGSAGVVLLTLNKDLAFDMSQLPGDIIVYLAGWAWAFFIIFNKKMLDHHSGLEVSSAAIVTCTVWLAAPMAYLALTGADLSIAPLGIAGAAYLALFCTTMATLLWALGLEGVSATASATIMLVEVVTALVISITLLEETMSPAAVAGGAMVLLAIALVAGTGAGEKPSVKAA